MTENNYGWKAPTKEDLQDLCGDYDIHAKVPVKKHYKVKMKVLEIKEVKP